MLATMHEHEIDNAAMAMKDGLWNEINDLNRHPQDSQAIHAELDKLRSLVDTLERIRGMWKSIHYSYKGKELVNQLLGYITYWVGEAIERNAKTLEQRLNEQRRRLWKLEEGFHHDEHDV